MDFSTIWNRHKAHLFNFIKDKVASSELAEDILQEVGVKYYNALKNGEIEKHKPWLFQVARNTIADFYRTEFKKILPTQSEIPEIADQNRYNACVCDLTGFVIQHYLPENYGKALFMADIENVPQKKIAETLNISFTAAKSRIQRARKMLKERVESCIDLSYNRNGSISGYSLKASCKLPPELLQEMARQKLSI
jgi:RNA polymerase sigma-70 factor, ECF subfamily